MASATEPKPIPRRWLPVIRFFLKLYTRLNVAVYRLSGGRLMNTFPGGYPICLVTMTGRRSGRQRTIPLIHIPHGDDVILAASQGGMDVHPVWYYNLKANPEVEVLAGNVRRPMRARLVDDAEKRQLWPVMVAVYPDFDQYQARTTRNIPVFLCTPTDR